jgi:hypothetical protein
LETTGYERQQVIKDNRLRALKFPRNRPRMVSQRSVLDLCYHLRDNRSRACETIVHGRQQVTSPAFSFMILAITCQAKREQVEWLSPDKGQSHGQLHKEARQGSWPLSFSLWECRELTVEAGRACLVVFQISLHRTCNRISQNAFFH